MEPLDEALADVATAKDAATACVPLVATPEAVGELAQRMIAQLAKPLATTIPIHDPRVRLKAFQIPLSSPDILGDLFQGGITYGEAGQFLTPQQLCEFMAALCIDEKQPGDVACDPCCGSGRMLLAFAEHHTGGELVGQDIDLRCVRMTSINLALRNLYGYVLWGNSLAGEVKLAYRTGMNMDGGFIRHVRPGELAAKFGESNGGGSQDPPEPTRTVVLPTATQDVPARQLHLF